MDSAIIEKILVHFIAIFKYLISFYERQAAMLHHIKQWRKERKNGEKSPHDNAQHYKLSNFNHCWFAINYNKSLCLCAQWAWAAIWQIHFHHNAIFTHQIWIFVYTLRCVFAKSLVYSPYIRILALALIHKGLFYRPYKQSERMNEYISDCRITSLNSFRLSQFELNFSFMLNFHSFHHIFRHNVSGFEYKKRSIWDSCERKSRAYLCRLSCIKIKIKSSAK